MVQEIISYIIIIFSFGITVYKFIRFFDVFKENGQSSACHTCSSGGCGSCGIKSDVRLNNIAKPIKIDSKNLFKPNLF